MGAATRARGNPRLETPSRCHRVIEVAVLLVLAWWARGCGEMRHAGAVSRRDPDHDRTETYRAELPPRRGAGPRPMTAPAPATPAQLRGYHVDIATPHTPSRADTRFGHGQAAAAGREPKGAGAMGGRVTPGRARSDDTLRQQVTRVWRGGAGLASSFFPLRMTTDIDEAGAASLGRLRASARAGVRLSDEWFGLLHALDIAEGQNEGRAVAELRRRHADADRFLGFGEAEADAEPLLLPLLLEAWAAPATRPHLLRAPLRRGRPAAQAGAGARRAGPIREASASYAMSHVLVAARWPGRRQVLMLAVKGRAAADGKWSRTRCERQRPTSRADARPLDPRDAGGTIRASTTLG